MGLCGRKKKTVCSGLLEETEGLIRDLRQEVADLRHAQAGRHDETRMMDESMRRLMEEKEKLLEDRLRAREELAEMKLKHGVEEQRAIRLASENIDLSREFGERYQNLNTSVESARAELKQTADLSETLKRDCKELKTTLKETEQKLKQTTAKLADAQDKYESSMAEVERLTAEVSNMEINKVMAENELTYKLNVLRKKYQNRKTLCRGKDVIINGLKEDRSRALIQLWHTTCDQKSSLPTNGILSPRKELPLATVEPFQHDVITMCDRSSPVQDYGSLGDGGRLSPEFPQNKTMSMEFELFRERKMAEILEDIPLPPSEEKGEGSDVRDDSSNGVGNYVDSLLDAVVEKQRKASVTSSNISSVSSEMIL